MSEEDRCPLTGDAPALTGRTCSTCPAFIWDAASLESGRCHGCRSGPPQMRVGPPAEDFEPSATDLLYRELIRRCLAGPRVTTRNSDCFRALAQVAVFDRAPLVGVRATAWKNCLREMEWFLTGSSNLNDLHERVRHWWAPWADESGEVANGYGTQLRAFMGGAEDYLLAADLPPYLTASGGQLWCDQVAYLIDSLTNHPYSRRAVATTWNTAEMVHPDTPITNCWGTVIQCAVDPADNGLELMTWQRSADVVVGLPANWLQMWAFGVWLGKRSGRPMKRLTWVGGDCHVYAAHEDLARRLEALRPPRQPGLVYDPPDGVEEFRADDFRLDGPYRPLVTERAEMIV